MTINLSQYKTDAKGNLIPLVNIKEIDLARDDLVREIFAAVQPAMDALDNAKQRAIADVRAFVELSAEKYGVKPSKKGNITLTSFDGKLRVNVAMKDVMMFDERLQAAKALIDECLNEWTQDSRSELRVIVQQAFDVDKDGHISTAKVLSLRSLKIEDAKWQCAMQALSDSLHTLATREYVRLYRRDERTGEWALLGAEGRA
jgi:hypothetical protein|nr:MAG TPA: Protein of unknown function (DUF3164) [Caudoviricetes sp.]